MNNKKSINRSDPDIAGLEIFEITPILLGGDPIDNDNKVVLDRKQHIEAVRYWNDVINKMKAMTKENKF